LPEDYLGAVKKTLAAMASAGYGELAGHILKQSWVHPNKRIFNNAKISDHFAIIPTVQMPKVLSEEEISKAMIEEALIGTEYIIAQ